MSGPAKHTTTYSASDIQRYWKGEMSAREMHDLEKAALEDPFLADALEGMETQDNALLSQHLDDLHARLSKRVTDPAPAQKTPARLFPLRTPWLRIAAAVILLVGLSVTAWYTLLRNSAAPALAKAKEPEAQSTRPPAAPPAPTTTADSTSAAAAPMAKATSPKPHRRATLPSDNKVVAPPAGGIAFSPPMAEKKQAPPLAANNSRTFGNNIAFGDSIVYNRNRVDSTYSFRGSVELRKIDLHPLVFSGKVLDANNKPLPGAVLQLAGNKDIGTITDQDGFFSLKVKPIDSTLRLTIGMVGYQQTSLSLNSLNTDAATGNVIHLRPQQNALDEVVVVGYGAKRKETRALAPSLSDEKIDSLWIKVQPVIGRQAYLAYLEAGKRHIDADSSIKGTVIISFNVTKNGDKTSFKVEQSLTPAHDAGVIHLISDGSAWKLLKGRSARTAVRVVF
jgi:hypothetical protein